MAKQTKKTTATTAMNMPFDASGFQDVFKTMASMNERMAEIAIQSGNRTADVAAQSTKDAIANMRELTQVRNDPTEYGKAFGDFAQKQSELFVRTAEALMTETQKASTETSELATKAGEEITNKVTANVDTAAQKPAPSAEKAA